MRGWIEVSSIAGQGTCIRLSFPLPSVIQHTMVFRSSGQLYALPMQFVQKAGTNVDQLPSVRLETLITDDVTSLTPGGIPLVLSCHQFGRERIDAEHRRATLLVDEIVGPEEVVVRPLPPMLKQHPTCCGATLSGLGETVLVLDTLRVVELAAQAAALNKKHKNTALNAASSTTPDPRPKVLIVDDSKSARARVVRSLRRYNVETVQACDGREAIELMARQHFSAVFSDMEMPHVDGMELLSSIQRSGQEHRPPVVIISSRDEDSFRKTATDLGASDYLIKPLAEHDLDESIQSIASLRTLLRVTDTPDPSSREEDS